MSATNPTQPSTLVKPEKISAWAPLREPVFRWLWIATLVSNIGTWMENVGEGWLMTSLSTSPLIVSLVQVANTLPMFMLALPAGSLADLFDRRKLLLISQTWMMIAAVLLAVLTALNVMTPPLLLFLTFLLGLGSALNAPAWRAITPEIVSDKNLSQAIVLNGLAVNGSRVIGPALGGAIIAAFGTSWVFILNAFSFIGVIAVIFFWKRKPDKSDLPGEQFYQSMVAGIRYVSNSQIMKSTLLHAAVFFPFTSAMFAMMPLVARQELQLGSAGYGVMLGCLGIGAISGAIILPRIQKYLSLHQIVMFGSLLVAILLIGLGLAKIAYIAYVALFIGGVGWMAVLSNLQTVVLKSVPGWVRARVMAVYLVCFFAAQTFGSFIWGLVSSYSSITVALVAAGTGLVLATLLTWRVTLPEGKAIDFTPTVFWPAPSLSFEPALHDGPVMITIEYLIDLDQVEVFKTTMQKLRRARMRSGAFSWSLVKDLEKPERYLEVFSVSSWLEHLRQHERTTALDKRLQERANVFHMSDQPPKIRHFLQEGI